MSESLYHEFVRRVEYLLEQDGERTYSGSVNIPVDIDEVRLGDLMLSRIEETDEPDRPFGAKGTRSGTRVSAYTLNPREIIYTAQTGNLGRGIMFGMANVPRLPSDPEIVIFQHKLAAQWITALRARMVLEDLADV